MKEYDPLANLRLRSLIAALRDCEKENDENGAVEIISIYLDIFGKEKDIRTRLP